MIKSWSKRSHLTFIIRFGVTTMNAQTKTMPNTATQPIEIMVDRFCDLSRQLEFVDSLVKERDHLRKLLAIHADSLGDGPIKISGFSNFISFSKAPKMRTIRDIGKFLEVVGISAFIDSVSVSTTKADKLLNESQKVSLFEESAGSRRVKDFGEIIRVAPPRQGAELFNFLSGLSNPDR